MPSELVLAIINAEESAREVNKNTKEHFKKFSTNVIDWKGFVIDPLNGGYLLLDKQKEGSLEELAIISPNNTFSIMIMVDGVVTYQGDFARFQEITTHISSVVARVRDSKYVLEITNLRFNSSILVIIDVNEKTAFDRIFCKYSLEV